MNVCHCVFGGHETTVSPVKPHNGSPIVSTCKQMINCNFEKVEN